MSVIMPSCFPHPRTPLDTSPPTGSEYDKGGDETMQLGRLVVHGASGRSHHLLESDQPPTIPGIIMAASPHPTSQPTSLPLSTTGKQAEDVNPPLLFST